MLNKIYIFIVLFLIASNLSCSGQDYFDTKEKPDIRINKIDENFVNFEVITDSKQKVAVLVADNDNFPTEIKKIADINNGKLDISNLKKLENNNLIVFNNNVNKSKKIELNNLNKISDYYFAIYKYVNKKYQLHKKIKFHTINPTPTVQAENLTFSKITDSSMTIGFVPGNGTGRIILMRKDTTPIFPMDAKEYEYSEVYGDEKSLIGENTYVVYKTAVIVDRQFTVTGLEPGRYYFCVLEYNGSGEYINYNTDIIKNMKWKSTSVATPVAIEGQVLENNIIVARWKKDPQVQYYLLDVAEDINFSKMIQPYDNVDVGDSNLVEIVLPFDIKEKVVYYRVRAFVDGNITKSSNIIKLEKK